MRACTDNGSIGGNGSWWPAKAEGMQILWAEDGAISYKNAYLNPGAFYHPAHPDPPCLSCQANYYEATLRTIFCNEQLRPWFGGVYVSAAMVGLSHDTPEIGTEIATDHL